MRAPSRIVHHLGKVLDVLPPDGRFGRWAHWPSDGMRPHRSPITSSSASIKTTSPATPHLNRTAYLYLTASLRFIMLTPMHTKGYLDHCQTHDLL